MYEILVTIRDIPGSEVLEDTIRKKAEKLTHFYKRINSCRVVVDVPQKHQRQGKLFNVRIDVTVPGKELAATRKENTDVYVALRDAFHAVERQLESYAGKRMGAIKTHDSIVHGVVARLFVDEGYGFIQGTDGDDYYFSMANVVHPRFDKLAVGDAVHFIVEQAQEGLQARRVAKERHNNHTINNHVIQDDRI